MVGSSSMRALALAVLLAACGGEDVPACVTVDTDCTPQLYLPTFDNVYTMTLTTSCGTDRSSCHSASGESGLSFADEQTAYHNLLDTDRVEPGNPGCSEMIVRVTSVGASYQMPQGPASSALSAGDQCSLIKWVAAGAPGPQ
jgi:hypothetical protein